MFFKRYFKDIHSGVVVIYIIGLFAVIVAQLLLGYLVDPTSLSETTQITINAATTFVWYFLLTSVLFRYAHIYLFKNQWNYFKAQPAFVLFMVLLGIALIVGVNLIVYSLFDLIGVEGTTGNQFTIETILNSTWYNKAMALSFVVLFGPIVEEIVFRKGVYGLIHKRFGHAVAIIGNTVPFALIHLLSGTDAFVLALPYFALGVVISFMYYYSGRLIIVPIIIHILANLVSVLFILV